MGLRSGPFGEKLLRCRVERVFVLCQHFLVHAPVVPQLTRLVLLAHQTEKSSCSDVLVMASVVFSVFDLAQLGRDCIRSQSKHACLLDLFHFLTYRLLYLIINHHLSEAIIFDGHITRPIIFHPLETILRRIEPTITFPTLCEDIGHPIRILLLLELLSSICVLKRLFRL